MTARRSRINNNYLQEAMALLIRNQVALVEQIARNDQERLALQRKSDERQLNIDGAFSQDRGMAAQERRTIQED